MAAKVYLQFPLMLIQNIHKDFEKGMQTILNFAMVDFALKQEVTPEDAARQLLYNALRGGGLRGVRDAVENSGLVDFDVYEDLEGTAETFFLNREHIVSELAEIIQKDQDLFKLATLNCKLSKLDKFFNVEGPGPDYRHKEYSETKSIIDSHQAKFGTEPRPTISIELFWDLYKAGQKNEFAAYVAIRSLEGNKKMTQTDRPTIAGRMAGAKSKAVLNSNPEAQGVFAGYNQRYSFDKLITELSGRNLIKSTLRAKHWRKFYLSTKLEPKELAQEAVKHKRKTDADAKNRQAIKEFEQLNKAAT